jgi:hypothetical protein
MMYLTVLFYHSTVGQESWSGKRTRERMVMTKDMVSQTCEPVSAVTVYQTGPPADKILAPQGPYPTELQGQLMTSKKK